jgi:formylglycine-generating enzyme required for sulfatase activity
MAAATAAAKPKAQKPAPAARRPGTLECRADLARQRRPYCRDGLASGGLGPLMVVLRGGTFSMGGDAPHAGPVHKVTIAHSFAISMREIGADEYELFCKATGRACPSQPWSADYPVVNVSWDDAVAYTAWLSKETGRHYRLPTEAEWEYSARAGSTGRYPSGDELLPTDARFSYQRQQTSPLPRTDRTINRNRFRLYNMLGNVREWVLDGWHSSYQGAPTDGSAWNGGSGHVVRGGSYRDGADKVQSASREQGPAGGDRYTGFRVVQEISAAPATSTTLRANTMKWVAERGLNQYTLQLFAVNSIASIEKIVARHPRLEIMIMPSDDPHEPYRVFYGIFDTRAEARLAYSRLPRDILLQVKKPLLRSFAQISQSSLVQR